MSIAIPFGSPLYVMLKPVGSRCNLACQYCYYLEKGKLYPEQEPLSEELLETFIRQYIEAQTMPEVLFTWHGGEPLLQPLSFYRKALELQQRYARGRQIDNCLQTNGTLLTDEWCEFLRENRFLVGISIDGPQTYHDAYRCRSFDKVMRGIRLLQKHSVEWNAMATVNHLNADDPVGFYRFFKEMLLNDCAIYNGEAVHENHGVMAGTPTSPFLANVYLKEVDKHFHEADVVYARYSDDIILFAPDLETLLEYKQQIKEYLKQYRLEVNPDKERIYSPDEAYEFLGFKCHGHSIDISEAAKKKMKGKIRRAARALLRWRNTKHVEPEKAMKGLINHFNRKFFETDDADALTWSRWFFPVITTTKSLHEIDLYAQELLRFLISGKHTKARFNVRYEDLKALGYRSLVSEYYQP